MAAYVIAQVRLHDAEQYKQYQALVNEESLAPFQGRFVVRGGGGLEHLDGSLDVDRIAVLEFPSRTEARAWFASEAYQHALQVRGGASTTVLTLMDGV